MEIRDGSILIAAITSCTNTSNPAVMLAAGLLAQKAEAEHVEHVAQIEAQLAVAKSTYNRALVDAAAFRSFCV